MTVKLNKKIALAATLAVLVSVAGFIFAQTATASLQSTSGQTVNLADLKGKVVVLSFGGTWVPLASKELPALQKLADRYGSRGVQVYWVSLNSGKQGARNYASNADLDAFAKKTSLRVPLLRDEEQKLYKELGLDGLPTVVILDRQGKVVQKQTGVGADAGDSYNAIARELDQILK
jgi:peroxiredoxin